MSLRVSGVCSKMFSLIMAMISALQNLTASLALSSLGKAASAALLAVADAGPYGSDLDSSHVGITDFRCGAKSLPLMLTTEKEIKLWL